MEWQRPAGQASGATVALPTKSDTRLGLSRWVHARAQIPHRPVRRQPISTAHAGA